MISDHMTELSNALIEMQERKTALDDAAKETIAAFTTFLDSLHALPPAWQKDVMISMARIVTKFKQSVKLDRKSYREYTASASFETVINFFKMGDNKDRTRQEIIDGCRLPPGTVANMLYYRFCDSFIRSPDPKRPGKKLWRLTEEEYQKSLQE